MPDDRGIVGICRTLGVRREFVTRAAMGQHADWDSLILSERNRARMFTHILIPLDGSAYGERVLAYAADLAEIAAARVTLLTVVPSDGSSSFGDAPATGNEQMERCRAYLAEHASALKDAGIEDVRTEVRAGATTSVIPEAARELGVDLIAMSTQGLGADSDEGLGSVASKVLMSAPCPLFMVRIRRPEPPRTVAEERWQSEGGANVG